MRKTMRDDHIRYKVDTVQVHEASTMSKRLNMSHKEKEILVYLYKHPGVALLYRFDKGWISSKNVIQVYDTGGVCTRMALCLMHNESLVYIWGRVKTFAMDVYFQLSAMSHDYLKRPILFDNMLKLVPEMRASLDVPFSQNTVFEQKILKERPEFASVFAYANTVLMFAARENNIDLLRMCLKAGANPNVRKKLGNKEAKELAFPTPGSGLEKALVSRKNTSQLPYQHILYYRSKGYRVGCTGLKQYGVFLEDEHGQTLYIRWNDIGKEDYVEVENSIIHISGYAMISYFKYGLDTSYYRSMDTALELALSFNHPDCVRALLAYGANPHLHKPKTGSVLASVFLKGHQEALDAFMQAFDRFADVKPIIEMMIDNLQIQGGAYDGSMDSDTKILDALVASRQYSYVSKFLSQMPNDRLFAYALKYYPRFLRATVCYPNHAELERMQANSSNMGKAILTHYQLHAVDVTRVFALNMPGLLKQLPQYPDLVFRYLRMSKPFSEEDVRILQMFFTSVLKNPKRHPAARVYYNGFFKDLQIRPTRTALAADAIDYWQQLVGASAFSRFMHWACIEKLDDPAVMKRADAKSSDASHAASVPADECVQAIRVMWQAQKPEAIKCPSMHLAASEDASPSSMDVFSLLDATGDSRIIPYGPHGVTWSLMTKQVQKLQRCKNRVERMMTRIDQRIASKHIDDIEKDIAWCVKMHAYVKLRVHELTSRCREVIDAMKNASQASRVHDKSVKNADGNDAKMDERKQASALKITGMFTKRSQRTQVRDTRGVKKTRAMQFFHTARHRVASEEESRLKTFVLHVARAAWPWAHAEFDDANERDAAQLCALLQWSIAMWQLHTTHKNTPVDLNLPCIALIRHYLVHHSYALDREEVMASLLALELFDQRCEESAAIDWCVALWSVYHPLLRSARQRFSQYLPEDSRNMYLLSTVLQETPVSPKTQHETLAQSFDRIEHVLIRHALETEEADSEHGFLHWLRANGACVRLLLLACMQLVESSSDTYFKRCGAKGHCLITLAFELKHGIRNPFAHQQIEVEKDDANHVVAYRLQDAPLEALGSRLSVFAGLVDAWRQVDRELVV